jgi:hypothetical protein
VKAALSVARTRRLLFFKNVLCKSVRTRLNLREQRVAVLRQVIEPISLLLPIAAILVQADGFLGFVATVTRFRLCMKPLRKICV